MRLRFELKLSSDYHVASGHGSGELIDSSLLRDSDGVPVLRGTTLAGLLRDGMRELLKHPSLSGLAKCADSKADAIEGGGEGRYCRSDPCPVCRIFGSPSQTKQWTIGSARPVSDPVTRELPLNQKLVAAQVVNRSSVDVRRRRTLPGKLFSREQGSRRLRFRFEMVGPDGPSGERDAALLIATARMTRNMGQSRRRGGGACTLHLIRDDEVCDTYLAEMLEKFRQLWLERPSYSRADNRQTQAEWATNRVAAEADQRVDTSRRIRLLLVTREPVLVGASRQAGNQIGGLDYIPGTALLGALAGMVSRRWNLDDNTTDLYKAFAGVFRRGRVRFPMLYPASLSQHGITAFPTVPAPRDLLQCRRWPGFDSRGNPRDDSHECFGGAALAVFPVQCEACAANDSSGAGHSHPLDNVGGYLTVMPTPSRIEPRMREEMHVRIDPNRKTAAEGDLFSYWAIDAGQHFYGELEFADAAAVDEFATLTGIEIPSTIDSPLELSLRLGRASRRGYGLVNLQMTEAENANNPPEARPSCRIVAPISRRLADISSPITLTFLTDTILLDSWGRYRQSVDERWLAEECFAGVDVQITALNQFLGSAPVGGFFSHLGLPRQREFAITAGSAIGFKLVGLSDSTREAVVEHLCNIELQGVGLRRGEGFGCVAFNHPVYFATQFSMDTQAVDPSVRLAADVSDDKDEIQALMTFIRGWSRTLESELPSKDFEKKPWSGVGHWLMAAQPHDLETVLNELKSLSDGQTTRTSLGGPEFVFRFQSSLLRDGNFFTDKQKGQVGLTKLKKVVERLKQDTEGETCLEKRAAGLRMIGGRLVSLGSTARGEMGDE